MAMSEQRWAQRMRLMELCDGGRMSAADAALVRDSFGSRDQEFRGLAVSVAGRSRARFRRHRDAIRELERVEREWLVRDDIVQARGRWDVVADEEWRQWMHDPEPVVRASAYEAMGIRRAPALLKLLLARLVEEDHRIALSALHFALALRGARGSVLMLGDMMLDPDNYNAQIRCANQLMELRARVPKSMRSWVVGRARAARRGAVRSVRCAMDELLQCYGDGAK